MKRKGPLDTFPCDNPAYREGSADGIPTLDLDDRTVEDLGPLLLTIADLYMHIDSVSYLERSQWSLAFVPGFYLIDQVRHFSVLQSTPSGAGRFD